MQNIFSPSRRRLLGATAAALAASDVFALDSEGNGAGVTSKYSSATSQTDATKMFGPIHQVDAGVLNSIRRSAVMAARNHVFATLIACVFLADVTASKAAATDAPVTSTPKLVTGASPIYGLTLPVGYVDMSCS